MIATAAKKIMLPSTYRDQLFRSLQYAGIATALALGISYPLTYWIAFRGGRWKNLLLLFIIAPFFVTYLIRTLAWETILSDGGVVVEVVGDPGDDGRWGGQEPAVAAVTATLISTSDPDMVSRVALHEKAYKPEGAAIAFPVFDTMSS